MSNFTKPSEAPAGGDGWKLTDDENIGSLFVFEPTKELEDVETEHGPKKVVVATVTEINEKKPAQSVTHDDVYIFAAWIQGDLRHAIADKGMVLGRLGQDKAKGKGKNSAWVLEDPSDDDIDIATTWLNGRSRSKLTGGKSEKSEKSKDKGEKSKGKGDKKKSKK